MAQEAASERRQEGDARARHACTSQRQAEIPPPGEAVIVDHGAGLDLRPVHVIKNGEEEIISYRAELMEEEKPYVVEMYGKGFALIKKGDTIRMVMEDEI